MKKEATDDFEISFPRKVKILIVQAPYYTKIAGNLVKGAVRAIESCGATYDVVSVPGALEIPAMVKYAVEAKKGYDAYVVLGCIIRGESYHFEIVCNESARKVYDVVESYNLALGNGILTVENIAQAEARSEPDGRNNGEEAARAALVMLKHKFDLGLTK